MKIFLVRNLLIILNKFNFLDPTNTRIERCFGELKFLEQKFRNLSLSNLLGLNKNQFLNQSKF